jgi:hypothetical protein
MKKARWLEFFEGDNNRMSMSRLLSFLSLFPATTVLIYIHSEEALAYYLSAYTLGYVGGKFADRKPRFQEESQ